MLQFDVLIIGSGSAGLTCALELPQELSVAIISKKELGSGCSTYAQGGMSVSLDNLDSHIADTLKASDGLANKESVEFLVHHSQSALKKLEKYGVRWTTYQGNYHLTSEGGHSKKRVAHILDHTGKSIQEALETQVLKRNNITIFTKHIAVDLLISNDVCGGCYALNATDDNHQVITILAKHTILATGGASKVYRYTTNPDTSTGDGIAMAYRAGCDIVNMEFSQFHPTCLYHPFAGSFLITEALRGEGAKLSLPTGESFIEKYDARKELAPRDIVALAIDSEMKKGGFNFVHLDVSFMDSNKIIHYFPTIYHKCLEFNIDITKDKIPVVPAAHYSCGGVNTDTSGKTNINNLYAIGEVAHTGVHGANRLASNSLLECVVFAMSCANFITNNTNNTQYIQFPEWDNSKVVKSTQKVIVSHLWDEVRLVMWNYVGIVRNNARLNYAQQRLQQISIEANDYYSNYDISSDLVELRNLILCAQIIIDSAISRKESRGLHYNEDYPKKNNVITNTQISR
jgi:L-aspartate oxidase